ncbi:MAG TPA: FAD-dependent oxidoreductase [Alphaproteobacteria bacterium]|nr:FAD-dependent oxidoreductase [Alphaproteobacteria bacterium]
MTILSVAGVRFAAEAPVLVVGAGAAGLVAALSARDAGGEVVVLERDPAPEGSSALSSGLIPAAGTTMQRRRGIDDSAERMAADIQAKAKGNADARLVATMTRAAGPAIDWLAGRHGVPFTLVEGFLYPGHSLARMHGTPRRTGAELMDHLRTAATRAGAEIICSAQVDALYAADDGRVAGARVRRPDCGEEAIAGRAMVLACSGFGGNPKMVREHIPEMAKALFFGHVGNRGDGIRWGRALGGAVRHMSAYQGHGSVATPHNILITWALMTEGGIQVNAEGRRFSNEHDGYSEQSVRVLAQPGGVAWNIYDARLHALGLEFEDYRNAVAAGAIKQAATLEALAAALGLPAETLDETMAHARRCALGDGVDPFGRDFRSKSPLEAPYCGVKVTGALFHTQGGLVVDDEARVCRADGARLPNLFAAGGTACGVSGPSVWGYLSGNGLLAAVTLGRLAGAAAARLSA